MPNTEKQKILEPQLPPALEAVHSLNASHYATLADGDELEQMLFVNVDFQFDGIAKVAFSGCVFSKCSFTENTDTRHDFVDCLFEGCDLASACFSDSSFFRCSFTLCRTVGTNFSNSSLRHSLFSQCQMKYANFGQSKLTWVKMQNNDLSNASFGDAQLKQFLFDNCILSGVEFFHTSLNGIDLRSSQIDGIILGDRSEIVGAIVTPLQACELALLLGVIIKE